MPATKTSPRTVTKRAAPSKATRAKPAPVPAAAAPLDLAVKHTVVAKSAKPVKLAKAVKAAKPPKLRSKPVRDSFTMPEADFALIATLKARTLAAKRETKKSELLRAGLHALAALDAGALVAALAALEPVKIGRPKSGH